MEAREPVSQTSASHPLVSLLRRMPFTSSRGRSPELVTKSAHGGRHATWLELFFDLVFVFTIAELTHVIETNLTLAGMFELIVLMLATFWVWIGFAYYADQFDNDDLPFRFFLIAGMFGVIVLSLSIHGAFHGSPTAFALCYVVLRTMIIVLYIRAWLSVEESRPLIGRLLASFVLGVLLFAISMFVPAPACYVLWVLALIVEYVGSPIAYTTIRDVPAQVSHMPERFGLFIIIVLGETVLAVSKGIENVAGQPLELIGVLSAFSIVVCMWWLYFNRTDEEVISRAVNSGRNRDLFLSYAYGYSHAMIAAGAVGGAASYIGMVKATQSYGVVSGNVYLFMGVSLAVFIAGTVLNHWAAQHPLKRNHILTRLGGAALLIGLGVTGIITDPNLFVITAAAIMILMSLLERPQAHHHDSAPEIELSS